MNLKLIACEILYRELCAVVARSVNRVDIDFLPKGLHDMGKKPMQARLQEAVAQVDQSKYDAIIMGYGLCSMGLEGLAADKIPIVLPRAHDCITLFLGDKDRYLDYFRKHPGVYFKTTGWIERGAGLEQYRAESIQEQSGMTQSYEALVEKYGEDNAKFLYEQLGDLTRNYSQYTYIPMGIEPDDRFEQTARQQAQERGWKFEILPGDLRLLQQLVDGIWSHRDFLVIPPGYRVVTSYNDAIVRADPVDPSLPPLSEESPS